MIVESTEGQMARADRGTLRARYDAVARGWQEMLSGLGYPRAYAALLRADRAGAEAQASWHVLDAGTGTGALAAAFIAAHGPTEALDLLDISPAMLAIAEGRLAAAAGRVTVLQGAIGQADLPARSYDAVLCAHALEHLEDPAAGLAWMMRLLRPGGRLILAVSKPHWCTALIRWRWGHRAYAPADVSRMLAQCGLSDIRVVPFPSGPPRRTSCGYLARAPDVADRRAPTDARL